MKSSTANVGGSKLRWYALRGDHVIAPMSQQKSPSPQAINNDRSLKTIIESHVHGKCEIQNDNTVRN